ncbi:MAG: DNA repair protein RecO [Acidobacteria bacterium]|nr:DNA repair protein RecO [Acidobacteriota bacterium]
MLRTYKLGEADRIVVFLTRDRGKKRGVAPSARRQRSRFAGALEPLTEVRLAYFEKEQRELVNLNYAEPVRSPMATPNPEALGYSAYFAELLDAVAADADPDERLYRLGTATLEAITAGGPVAPLARYFECWLLRLQGVYPADVACAECGTDFLTDDGAFLAVEGHGFVCRPCHGAQGTADRFLSARALAFIRAARRVRPLDAAGLGAPDSVLRELDIVHRALLGSHLDRQLKSVRVVQALGRPSR